MDRRLILAVAGSGKTTFLINKLDLVHRFLIITYTDNNRDHHRRCIIEKFGYEPENITLLTYFQFLIRVCYRPFLKDIVKARGITYKMPDAKTLKLKRNNPLFYLTKNMYLYHNRIAKLCQERCAKDIRNRIEKFYDCLMIDEVQDFGGHDFNLIQSIIPQTIDSLFVGDFFQHTYDTSLDGNINSSLYKNIKKYKKRWIDNGVMVDEQTLSNSYRCSPNICEFVQNKLGIAIASHRTDETIVRLIETQEEAESIYAADDIVKLFLQEANKYECYSTNWGASKGLDKFKDICIVLNKTTLKAYRTGNLGTISPSTLRKLYVACTRAKGNIYFVPHTFIDKYKKQSS